MRKALHPLLIGLAAVLMANVLTWAIGGQERALFRGAEIGEIAISAGGIDTLYLFIGQSQGRKGAGFEAFSPATIEQLARDLRATGRVVSVDQRPLPLVSADAAGRELIDTPGSHAFAYDVSVERPFPLVVEVTRFVWAPGFGTDESALYVWFFGWRHVVKTGFGIS